MNLKITAVVPVKAVSTRLPGKNAMEFHGRPLVGHKVWQLAQVPDIDDVVVASDSDELLAMGEAEGAIPLVRTEFCDEAAAEYRWNQAIHDIVSRVEGDIIVWAHATNPCISPARYQQAIEAFWYGYFKARTFDSLVSVGMLFKHCWYPGAAHSAFLSDYHGAKPINHPGYTPQHTVGTGLMPVYWQDGGIFIYPRDRAVARRYVYGESPMMFPLYENESIDIDTAEDFERAVNAYDGGGR